MRAAAAAALVTASLLPGTLCGQAGDKAGEEQPDLPAGLVVPPAIVRTPAEELATFSLQPGYAIELVAAEPLVMDPVAATFDAAGRLWVVEMRSYMRDIDGAGERSPDGAIAVLHDDDADGRMDRRTVFLAGLVLPRAVLPLRGGALVLEPPNLLFAADPDGDCVADEVVPILDGFEAGLENPEHAGNGLCWALDNFIHLANDVRLLRWTPSGFEIARGAGGGQWGIAQDDRGRLFFNYNEDWLRCDLLPGRYAARPPGRPLRGHNHRVVEDTSVWPIRVTPGVNRGYRPSVLLDGRLQRHTSVCAPLPYRGDLLPKARGTVFVCEPAANLVRQFELTDHDGLLRGTNRYQRAEFLASTDERFRPVNLCAGPEGALYLVDMYRGVIQHRNFVTSFLRRQVAARQLERPTGLGRIWRIVPDGAATALARPLQDASTAALVAALGTCDGWQRDIAQQLLVQRQDQAAVPLLRRLLRASPHAMAQSHALFTLDGLGALGGDDLRCVLNGSDSGALAAALQLAAPFLSAGDPFLWTQCELLAEREVPALRWQLALLLGDVTGRGAERALSLLAALAVAAPLDPVLQGAVVNAAHGRECALLRALARLPAAAVAKVVRALAHEVGRSRDAARLEALLTVAANELRPAAQAALLQGLGDALPADAARRQGHFVLARTPPGLAAMAQSGGPELQQLAAVLAAAIALREISPEVPAGNAAAPSPEERRRYAVGAAIYRTACGACHQPDGSGLPGLAPPLAGSEWVTGDPERLIGIALFGLRGPLEAAGVAFDGEMPGQAHLGDRELADALSWLRSAFGHDRPPVPAEQVAAVRARHRGRSETFRTAELLDR